jgi:hypothetical protein
VTVPAQLPSINVVRENTSGAYGPIMASNGYIYAVGAKTTGDDTLGVARALDPTDAANWTLLDDANRPTTIADATVAFAVDGNTIHILHSALGTATLKYSTFSMSTNAWVVKDETVAADMHTTVSQYFDICVRSTGEVIAFYNGPVRRVKGTDYDQVMYRRRLGTNSWSSAVRVDTADDLDQFVGHCTVGASDRVHFVWRIGNLNIQNGRMRTLSSANVLQTDPPADWAAYDKIVSTYYSPAAGGLIVGGDINEGFSLFRAVDFRIASTDSTTGTNPAANSNLATSTDGFYLPAFFEYGGDVYTLGTSGNASVSTIKYRVATGGSTTWGALTSITGQTFNGGFTTGSNHIMAPRVFWRTSNTKLVLCWLESYLNHGYYEEIVLDSASAVTYRPRARGRHAPTPVRARGRERGVPPDVPRARGRQAT